MSLVQCPSETPHFNEPRYYRKIAVNAPYGANGPGMLAFHNLFKVAIERAPGILELPGGGESGTDASTCRRHHVRKAPAFRDRKGKHGGNYAQHCSDREAFLRDRSARQKLGFMTAETAKMLILIGTAAAVLLQLLLVLFTRGV